VLSRALGLVGDAAVAGERDARALRQLLASEIAREPLVRLDYAELVDAATLAPVDVIASDTLVAVAAFVGRARLIDNVTIAGGPPVTYDFGRLATTARAATTAPQEA
jgi:pantoate--beta-alanine ligase